ncbi:(2Fe-2S)-binding protein [Thermodesulfobacteriota bacterium]
MKKIAFELNGNKMEMEVVPSWTLLELLRDHMELRGSKSGCEVGECGACTVIINNKAVNACLFPVMEINGMSITTIEGVAKPTGELHPIQQAFIDKGGVQCGFCTPGMIMSSKALLDENSNPDEEDIRHALSGNFCRCTGYTQIVEAVETAGESLRHGQVFERKSQ